MTAQQAWEVVLMACARGYDDTDEEHLSAVIEAARDAGVAEVSR